MFEGIFVRNSSGNNGSMFSFAANDDRCTSDFNSVKGTADPPVPTCRGASQFVSVNAKQW